MTVQVNYTNKDKSSDLGVIALFADEKFQIKNINNFFSKKDIKKILSFMLKDKKNKNEKINLILLKKISKVFFCYSISPKY